MKWSWKLARFAGIDVYVHATFFILIAWISLIYWQAAGNLLAVISGVGFILILFACVLLHEFGHALTARRYGYRTQHITLLPIGGMAVMESLPDDPKQEILVALAGPAVNVVIASAIWLWLWLSGSLQPLNYMTLTTGTFLERLMIINFVLAVFNLLPAFPMDGGRVLRAALTMRMNRNRATWLAARVGKAFALLLGFLGLFYNPLLILIALFVWIGASSESKSAQIKFSLSDAVVGHAMLTEFQTLAADEPLSRAIELTIAGSQKDFPVMQDDIVVGVIGQVELLQGLAAGGKEAQVADWMQREVQRVDINEPLEKVLQQLQNCHCRLLTITKMNRLAGIINIDNIAELIRIQDALQERQ